MRVTIWGARGSLATPGPETARYGGNTSCVEVCGSEGCLLVLDAGTGIRRLGMAIPSGTRRIDILLTHLHIDHIEGLGFFEPLYHPETEVHIWGPASLTQSLYTRLNRYLSPPLFPIHLRDFPKLLFHDAPLGTFEVAEFRVTASLICHPGPTVGYRIEKPGATLAYLPDHEPALGAPDFPLSGAWTSGYSVAKGADILIHDAQCTEEEYAERVGWGHSSVEQAVRFARLTGAKHLVPFHHDPARSDEDLDLLFQEVLRRAAPPFPVTPAMEGMMFESGKNTVRLRRRQPHTQAEALVSGRGK